MLLDLVNDFSTTARLALYAPFDVIRAGLALPTRAHGKRNKKTLARDATSRRSGEPEILMV